jgi:DNA-binding Lrp family transcriptional regulator
VPAEVGDRRGGPEAADGGERDGAQREGDRGGGRDGGGQVGVIDPQAVGRAFEVLVNIDLSLKDGPTVSAFEDYVSALEEVVEFRRMFGLPDYFLRVATRDIGAYEQFVTGKLTQALGIAKIDSHLPMKAIK